MDKIREQQIEEELRAMAERDSQMQEDLRQATEALSAIEEEKTENPSKSKLPFYKNKMVQVGALATVIATEGGVVAKKFDWQRDHAPALAKKDAQKNTLETTNKVFTSTTNNLSAEATRLREKAEEEKRLSVSTNKPITAEELRAQIAEMQRKFDETKVERVENTFIAPPKPATKTRAELIAEIETKLTEGKEITADEALLHNWYIQQPQSETKKTATISKSPERRGGVHEPGWVNPYNPPK